jgi:heptosyltransferase I
MRILIIKMSSLGDIIHALPAITEIKHNLPNSHITWLVEPGFKEIATWHSGVDHVITMPLRHLKQNLKSAASYLSVIAQLKLLQEQQFDIIIDAQGLLKSALIARISNGISVGFCKKSAREPIVSALYDKTITVHKNQHAVLRTKHLCASACGYTPDQQVNYNLNQKNSKRNNNIILFHGTTWPNKHYPPENWQKLIKIIAADGYNILLPWGNAVEHERAQMLSNLTSAQVLPKLTLTEIKDIIAASKGAIGVDTGLSHLAAATATPCVAIYGPTSPDRAKNYGASQDQVTSSSNCAPCMKRKCAITSAPDEHPCMKNISPLAVWHKLQKLWDS